MITDQRTRELVYLLTNKGASVEERDDAAMDLAESDAPAALRALLKVASDEREPEILQASAGESLALIWLRNGLFRRKILEQLTPVAKAEVESLLARERSDWLA